MLRLQTQRGPARIHRAAFSFDRPVQKIPGVKLNAGLGRPDLHHTTVRWLLYPSRETDLLRANPIDHPVVVVSFAKLQLLVVMLDPRPDRRRLAEIEWSARNRFQHSCRNQPAIHRSEMV